MKIIFTIYGNHEDPVGNPIPYVRSTRAALWRSDGKRYAAWKGYVQKSLILSNLEDGTIIRVRNDILRFGKPLDIRKTKAWMDIKIYWKNGSHGDPDNIFKGIADALFLNDRNLDGSFESCIAEDGKPKVEVIITWND